MQQLLNVYKPLYATPLQVIDALRLKFPEYKESKIGYAGRLDPLAHGVLLLMVGEEAKQREKYLDLPKTYEFEALLGLQTDTYDLLGLLQNPPSPLYVKGVAAAGGLKQFIQSKLGSHTQPYPPFSSKAVGGKPLHWWAKQNRLSEITIPTREITIYSFELLSTGTISVDDLKEKIKNATTVQGSFRQTEILEAWGNYFSTHKAKNAQSTIRNSQFPTARFRVSCSSGTYVRGLVHELGKYLETGAVTTEILRTEVGEYTIEASLRLQ